MHVSFTNRWFRDASCVLTNFIKAYQGFTPISAYPAIFPGGIVAEGQLPFFRTIKLVGGIPIFNWYHLIRIKDLFWFILWFLSFQSPARVSST